MHFIVSGIWFYLSVSAVAEQSNYEFRRRLRNRPYATEINGTVALNVLNTDL